MSELLSTRRYRPQDQDRVLELHEEALRAAGGYVEGAPEPDLEDVEAAYLAEGDFVVGEFDGRVVSMGALRPVTGHFAGVLADVDEATAELKRLRVDPEHQRRGFGQATYDDLERRARDLGFEELVLDTTPQQTAAREFFAANGFECAGRETFTLEGESFEALFYRKQL